MNNVSLIGRLTADPELKTTPSGLSYVRCSLAVDRTFVRKSEERQADFINILAWRKTAEFICRYFGKGQRIALTGRIQTGSYTDKDGGKRYTFEVVAENVEFCEAKKDSGVVSVEVDTTPPESTNNGSVTLPNEEDLPF